MCRCTHCSRALADAGAGHLHCPFSFLGGEHPRAWAAASAQLAAPLLDLCLPPGVQAEGPSSHFSRSLPMSNGLWVRLSAADRWRVTARPLAFPAATCFCCLHAQGTGSSSATGSSWAGSFHPASTRRLMAD